MAEWQGMQDPQAGALGQSSVKRGVVLPRAVYEATVVECRPAGVSRAGKAYGESTLLQLFGGPVAEIRRNGLPAGSRVWVYGTPRESGFGYYFHLDDTTIVTPPVGSTLIEMLGLVK